MVEHYFSADPTVPFERQQVQVSAWGHSFEIESGRGVFSAGHVDIGTSVLLRETVPPERGRILDLGCGYGVIGLALAMAAPGVAVHGVDVNERAVRLANDNAERLGLTERFSASIPREAEGLFDAVWSNPPIRIGKEALHELLGTWLTRVRPGGTAVMVVGRNLGADTLARWLDGEGYPTRRLASAKGFRVLHTQLPSRAAGHD